MILLPWPTTDSPLGFGCVERRPYGPKGQEHGNPINAKIIVWPFDGGMALSRRDRLIVARHEVPG